jgi:hypothetical protein
MLEPIKNSTITGNKTKRSFASPAAEIRLLNIPAGFNCSNFPMIFPKITLVLSLFGPFLSLVIYSHSPILVLPSEHISFNRNLLLQPTSGTRPLTTQESFSFLVVLPVFFFITVPGSRFLGPVFFCFGLLPFLVSWA